IFDKSSTSTTATLNWTSPLQLLTVGGDASGSFKLKYGNVESSAIVRTDEVQQLTLSGAAGGTVQLSLDNVTATTQLTFQPGVSPTAVQVQAHLARFPLSAAMNRLKSAVRPAGRSLFASAAPSVGPIKTCS